MFGNWFSTKEVDEFADSVVAEVSRRFPASGIDLDTDKDVERAIKRLESLFARVDAFAKSAKPNLFKKARFGNRVRWALKDSGYPAPFADVISHHLTAQMTVAARIPGSPGPR